MIGLPAGRNEWRGNNVTEHLDWLKADGQVGLSFWDAQVKGSSWHTLEVWKTVAEIGGKAP
jgi:hypothetical protein